MLLYNWPLSPSPRRVRMFIAEKGITIPMQDVDLSKRAQLEPEYKAINDRCDVPFLVLDDSTGIGEVEGICRYLEAQYPEPPLFGRTPEEQGVIAMWNHRMEQEGFFAVAEGLRNTAERFADRAVLGPHNEAQIAELGARGKRRVERFFAMLDDLLADRPFIAGESFSVADISGFVTVEFAKVIGVTPGEDQKNLRRWHGDMAGRPSATA